MSEIKVHVEGSGAFFARAQDLAKRLDQGTLDAPENHLSFESLESLLRALTPDHWTLLRALKAKGPASIRALAPALERDDDAVHADIAALIEIGLIERGADGSVSVPWSRISAEMDLAA